MGLLTPKKPIFWGPDLDGSPGELSGADVQDQDRVPVPTPRPPYVTSAQGGDADALTRHIESLDPRLSPWLGQMHWVAVGNSVGQDDTAKTIFDQQPRGYDSAGADPHLRYRDLEGLYVDRAHNATDPHVTIATSPNRLRSGSIDTPFHETGHGIDETSDDPSQGGRTNGIRSAQPDFTDAYGNDKSLWRPGTDDYYFKNDDGRSEAYAESFARYFGGDKTLQERWPGMYKYWADRFPNPRLGDSWK